jgi:hypothetical protein
LHFVNVDETGAPPHNSTCIITIIITIIILLSTSAAAAATATATATRLASHPS